MTEKTASFGFRDVPEGEKEGLVREVFSSVAARYDLMNDLMSAGIHRIWKDAMVEWLNPQPGWKTLDVAGGTGDIAFRIVEMARARGGEAAVTVCDINPDMLGEGRRRAGAKGEAAIQWVCGDAEKLPFRPGSFDVVFCKGSLHHVRNHVTFLANCREALGPRGVLVMSEPCNDNPLIRFARAVLYRKSPHFDEGDEGFTKKGIIGLCEQAGFEVVKAKKYGVLAYVFAGFPDHLGAVLVWIHRGHVTSVEL